MNVIFYVLAELDDIVVKYYQSARIDKESTLAYKGGHNEPDLLTRLGIPSVNMERYSCPKAELLFDDLVWLQTCGNHTEHNAYHHCAKVEVETFGHGLSNQVY